MSRAISAALATVALTCLIHVIPAAAQPNSGGGAAGHPGEAAQKFPAVGHAYRVDFVSPEGRKFSVELAFASEISLTYTGIRSDGTRGASETVTTEVTAIAPDVFMVTWKESDKTTVVHVEDYGRLVFYTNITDGGNDHEFSKFKGTATLIR